MSAIVVIPCRYGSSRFPGKPLVKIAGYSLVRRVWSIAKSVSSVNDVVISTDDERIREHAESFGAHVIMTDPACRNGTERVFTAVQNLAIHPDIIVNVQGDAVLTPPIVISSLVTAMLSDPSIQIGTPAVRLTDCDYRKFSERKARGETGGTFVTFDSHNNALYFSKAVIPHLRDGDAQTHPVYRHIGIYGYRSNALRAYLDLPPSRLEEAEKLEQLRALEHGMPIRVIEVDYGNRTAWSVDTPDDARIAEEIIAREGELVPLTGKA